MNLLELAKKHKTDKWEDRPEGHKYIPVYEKEFSHLKDDKFTFLEIGIGGYKYLNKGGNSLRMWREWFTKADVHGMDLYKKGFDIPGVSMHFGSQTDKAYLENLINKIGRPKIIIDDASHINDKTITTFEILFPLLEEGGIYAVEDVHTSYWEENYGGCSDIYDYNAPTTLNYFKHRIDQLNWQQLGLEEPQFTSISFYKELIILKK